MAATLGQNGPVPGGRSSGMVLRRGSPRQDQSRSGLADRRARRAAGPNRVAGLRQQLGQRPKNHPVLFFRRLIELLPRDEVGAAAARDVLGAAGPPPAVAEPLGHPAIVLEPRQRLDLAVREPPRLGAPVAFRSDLEAGGGELLAQRG